MSERYRSVRIRADLAAGRLIERSRARIRRSLLRFVLALIAFPGGVLICDGAQGALPGDRSVYQRAFELLSSGHAVEALAEADAALNKDPASSELYNVRGMAADQIGRTQEAEASFHKVIELSPRSSVGYNNLAALLARLGRNREAEPLFRAALERDPHSSAALLGLGETLATLRNYPEAANYLRQARRLSPSDFQTAYEYARVLRELKRPVEADRVLHGISAPDSPVLASKYHALSATLAEDVGDRKRAAQLYARAYQLAPDSFDSYVALVRAYLELALSQPRGNPSESLKSLPPPAHLSAEDHFALGVLFASRGAYPEAIPHFEETLRLAPASYSAAFNLAVSYDRAGNRQAAVDCATKTLARQPTAELYDFLATLEESSGRYLEAVRHFQGAVELDPASEQYLFDLGAEYLAHFTFVPATEIFRVGTRKFPRSARQFLGLGYACYAQRQYPEAGEAFLAALEIDPASRLVMTAWNSLPAFLPPAERERFLPRLRRLTKLHPQTPEVLFCYGMALFRSESVEGQRGGYELARSLLERTVALRPNLSEARLELGNLYAARGEKEKATAEFREVIKLQPGSEMGHYRLGQIYRDQGRLAEAQKELALYAELSRRRREEMASTRSAIKQFILGQSPGNPSQPKTSF